MINPDDTKLLDSILLRALVGWRFAWESWRSGRVDLRQTRSANRRFLKPLFPQSPVIAW